MQTEIVMEKARQLGKVARLEILESVRLLFKMNCYLVVEAPILDDH